MAGFRKLKPGIVAIYRYLDDVEKAMEAIEHRKDCKDHVLVAPTSYHELMEIAEKRFGPSQVRWFTLAGALTGLTTGFSLPLWCDFDWPIVVGGKSPIFYSLPAYVIPGFELMVLFGAICTIAGIFVMGRFPDPYADVLDDRLTDDHFAIYVPGADMNGEQAKLLRSFGAVEMRARS